jgi:hypothetical protein
MHQSAFGVFLRKLREKRGLSLREPKKRRQPRSCPS